MGNVSSKHALGSQQHKSQLLSRHFLKKHYSITPVIFIMVADLIFAASTLTWMYNTRDIVIDRSKKPINERMDLLRPYLLRAISVSDDLRPGVELHDAYEAMKEEEIRREEERKNRYK